VVVGGAVAAAAMAAPSPAPASAALPFDSAAFPVPSYAGEVAIVTGGTTGIGAACCAVLARAGAKVALARRHSPLGDGYALRGQEAR
jgi:NADPH:quinone reductase-like Zn-dependent oxidoreductase